jgi:hypothetical protein
LTEIVGNGEGGNRRAQRAQRRPVIAEWRIRATKAHFATFASFCSIPCVFGFVQQGAL